MATVDRDNLISAGLLFIERVRTAHGVHRIALIGSILTENPNPKDIDFLLTVSADADVRKIAYIGRRLKGGLNSRSLGADIFLATLEHEYIGRTCSHRECHYRAGCGGLDCRPDSWIKTDLHIVEIERELIYDPPVVVWPKIQTKIELPPDIARMVSTIKSQERGTESAA